MDEERQRQLVDAFANNFLLGQGFTTITAARQQAEAILGEKVKPGTPLAKRVDESVEAGLVRAARAIVQGADDPLKVYDCLVNLYQRQPILGTRSSTSVRQQAYSTPIPIAYLAAQLAGIDAQTTVYEPTAGHGALLLLSDADRVIANELNREREADLRSQGYAVTQFDATSYCPDGEVDVVIANPPFGSVRAEDGRTKVFSVPRAGVGEGRAFVSTQIDHAIALNSLKAMKSVGKAVLILGGQLGDERSRSNGYNSQTNRLFYYTLYNEYNVTRHISIDGDLYRRQGAGFPIDLIVIEGRGKSELTLPAATVPRIYRSFDQLKELLNDSLLIKRQQQSMDASFGRGDGRDLGSGASAEPTGNNPQPQSVLGATGFAGGMVAPGVDGRGRIDTQAGSQSSAPVPRRETSGLGSDSVVPAERFSASGLGEGTDRREPGIVGEVLPASREQLSDPTRPERSVRAGTGSGANRGNVPGGMVATSDYSVWGELDAEAALRPDQSYTQSIQQEESLVAQEDRQQAELVEEATTTALQVPYAPKSTATQVGTLVPTNMQTATALALSKLESQVGNLDAYVATKLEYGTPENLHRYFSAEQVDAIALGIHNLDKGAGFIIGDQTGVGKGRVVAAMIRYAKLSDRIPIFVTKNTQLYGDMMRDLADIDMARFQPFATNSSLNVPLANGQRLRQMPTTHSSEMSSLMGVGNLGQYDAIFTTYDQMRTVKGQLKERHRFLEQFAPQSIVIMDESHEAGGSSNPEQQSGRALFARRLLALSQGAIYSSATFAKNPQVMTLYFKTDMPLAVNGNVDSLVTLVNKGGIPLQQGLSATLAEAGQYIRRERSYEGVDFRAEVRSIDRDTAENISAVMAAILDFDQIKKAGLKALDKQMKAEAKQQVADNSTGSAGAESTNFTSIMHNLLDQMLLAGKAEATVQECIETINRGEKPVVAVANTMASAIERYAEENNLALGQPININFGNLLKHYLKRSRDVILNDVNGVKTRRPLTDAELGAEGVIAYESILSQIDEIDFGNFPVSPIDYIRFRLEQSGYSFNEITGRTDRIQYNADGSATYEHRSTQETSTAAKIRNTNAFNSGRLDVLLINRSGSTGISLHASRTFSDQRPRHLIVAQAERNVNDFVQTLGRVHRTGQVVLPAISLLMADIPAEKRLGALLCKKMASLNANATAARKGGGVSLDAVPDFINEYGDAIITEIMANKPELHARLGWPLGMPDEELIPDNAISKVTGRIPLLPIAQQEKLYDLIESEYQEFVARQEAMGESVLEAKYLDLKAQTVSRMEVHPSDNAVDSPFTRAVQLEVVSVQTPRKPYTTLQVVNSVRESLGISAVEDLEQHDFYEIERISARDAEEKIDKLKQAVEKYRVVAIGNKTGTAAEKFNETLNRQFQQVEQTLAQFPVGQTVRIVTQDDNIFYGTVSKVWNADEQRSNPATPSSWKVRFLLADPAKELTVPMSKINRNTPQALNITATARTFFGEDIYELFDLRQIQNREERQIFTGNILKAFNQFSGKVINYSTIEGEVRQGLLTAKGFDIEKTLEKEPVRMPTVEDAIKFITEVTGRTGTVKTLDEALSIKADRYDENRFILSTAKAKSVGGKYYLDEDILEAVGGDFHSVGDSMRCYVDAEDIHKVLSLLVNEKCLAIAAFDGRDKARDMLGIQLPQLEQAIGGEFSEQGVQSPRVDEPLPETPSLEQTLAATNSVLSDTNNASAVILQGGDAQQVAPLPPSTINLEVQRISNPLSLDAAAAQTSEPLESAGDRALTRTPNDQPLSNSSSVAETEQSLLTSARSLIVEEEQPVITVRSRQEPLESSLSTKEDFSAKPPANCRSENSQVLPVTGSLANFFDGEMSLSDALQLSNSLPKAEATNAPDCSKQSQTSVKLQPTETQTEQLSLFATTNNSTPITSSARVPANPTTKPRRNLLRQMEGGEQLSLLDRLGGLSNTVDHQDMAVAQGRSQQTDSGNNGIAATPLDASGQSQSQLIQREALETARSVQQLLKQIGTLQSDGFIIFEGDRWQFAFRGDLVTITVKQDQRQILQVDGDRVVVFSLNSKEREKLQQLRQDVARDLQQPQPKQQQQHRQGLSR